MTNKSEFVSSTTAVSNPAVFYWLLGIISVNSLGSSGEWVLRMGCWALALGVLVILSRGKAPLPRGIVYLALVFTALIFSSFLPVDLIGRPTWRLNLEALGLETGPLGVVQWKQALEFSISLLLLFYFGLWLMTHRTSKSILKNVCLLFVLWVAFYSFLGYILRGELKVSRPYGPIDGRHFGFFPNGNHSANFLSMGFMCGLGVILQAIREKEFVRVGLGIGASALIFWAIFNWSTSRSGFGLCLFGPIVWAALLGRRYFRIQELKAFGLLSLLAIGVFAISESDLKKRLADTVEKLNEPTKETASSNHETPLDLKKFDLRVAISKDTFRMIGEAPFTGVGSGQFRYIFPQFRKETTGAFSSTAVHPESSWLLLAAEIGIPATLVLLGLVIVCFSRGVKNIRQPGGKERSIRLACLVAALFVPIHSFLDVVAHRPVLSLTAVMLFVISQNLPDSKLSRRSSLPSLLFGSLLLLVAIRIFIGPQISFDELSIHRTRKNLENGAARIEKLNAKEGVNDLMDLLVQRQELSNFLVGAKQLAPLEGRFYRMNGLANMPIDFKSKEVTKDFMIDRALKPRSVNVPMIHGNSALFFNHDETRKAWLEAIRRAEQADRIDGTLGLKEKTIQQIRVQSKISPDLDRWFDETIIPKVE